MVNLKACLEVMTASILTRLNISKRFMGRSGMNVAEDREIHEFVEITEEIVTCLGIPNPRNVILTLL